MGTGDPAIVELLFESSLPINYNQSDEDNATAFHRLMKECDGDCT